MMMIEKMICMHMIFIRTSGTRCCNRVRHHYLAQALRELLIRIAYTFLEVIRRKVVTIIMISSIMTCLEKGGKI